MVNIKNNTETIKNRFRTPFIISLIIGAPGVLVASALSLLASNGTSGTEFVSILFVPLYFASFIGVPAAIILGLFYALNETRMKQKLIAWGIVVVLIIAMMGFLLSALNSNA